MKDKITAQVLDAVTKIEKEEVTFEKRLQCLLDEYKQIYKVDNVTYEDLIKRKIYLKRSKENWNVVLLSLLLSGGTTYLIKAIDRYNINIIALGEFNIAIDIFIYMLFAFILYVIIDKILIKFDFRCDKYNQYDFEIDLIDTIIKEHFQLDSVKKDILRLNYRNYKSRKRKRRTKKRKRVLKYETKV